MNSFRIKPSSSQPSHRSSTPQPNSQQFFPFSNKKLKHYGWEDESIKIKRFKSNTQISRKKYEFIPILKALKLNNEKVSIVKSAKNEYNIFMSTARQKRRNCGVDCINGIKSENQKDGELFFNSKLMGINRMSITRSNSLVFGNRFERAADFTSSYSGPTPLQVSGQSKCMSPSRSGTRSKIGHHEQKIIML